MADYTSLKAAIASVIKTNGNQEITGLLLQQTLHSMLDGVNTTKQDTINFVLNTANKFLRDDGSFQEILSPAGGFANNLYFTNVDSPIVTGYKSLSYTPDSTAVNINASVTAAEGEKVVQTYIYPSGVSVDLYPSGLWSFNFYGNIDLTVGVTQLGVQYFKRSTAGVETNLFTAWSEELNNTIPKWIPFEATNPSFIVDPTDRMGARILVKTTSTPAVNVTFVIGDGYAAYLNNPNRIRHSQLRDWNGDPNYQHITQTEKTNFQTAYTDRFKWDGGSSGLNAVTGRESLGLRIGIDVLAYRTFGSAANNNTNDFLAYNGVAVDSSKLGGQLPSYYQTNITAGTSLQYYRGDKTMQTLDTSVVPENSNMYFTYPRVLATALTGYAAGANTALSATDTILAAMGKIQGQINARALASDLSGHINNTTIHLTADEKTYLGKIMTYLKVAVDNTSMYSTINFYSESGVSAYGIGTGGGGGAGVDIIDYLTSTRTDAALSANQGRILKGFVDLKQPQLNGLGFVKANGISISYDNNSYALASSLSNYLPLSGGTLTGDLSTRSFWSGQDGTGIYFEATGTYAVNGLRLQHPKSGGGYNQLLINGTNNQLLYNGSQLLSTANYTSYAATASHNHNGTYALIGGSSSQAFNASSLSLSQTLIAAGAFDGNYYESIRFSTYGYPTQWTNAIYSTQSGAASASFLEFRLSNGETTRNVALKLGNLLATFSGGITMNGALSGATTISASGALNIGSGLGDYQLNIDSNGRYSTLSFKINNTIKSQIYWDNDSNTMQYTGATTFFSSVSAASFTSGGNAVLHAGNFSSYALPLSGGVLTTSGISPLAVNSTHATANEIDIYFRLSGVNKGAIGFYGGWASPSMYMQDLVNGHTLRISQDGNARVNENIVIHAGNIGSQSVNYAASASRLRSVLYSTSMDLNTHLLGGGIVGNYGSGSYWVNGPSGMSYGSVMQFDPAQSSSILSLQLAFDIYHNNTSSTKGLWFRTSNNLGWQNDWKEIYHSGNSNSSSVAWAASTFTEGGTLLSNKYTRTNGVANVLYTPSSLTVNLNTVDGLAGIVYTEGQNCTNAPTSYGSFLQFADAGGNDVRTQFWNSYDGTEVYTRIMWGNTYWKPWRKLWHDGNLTNTLTDSYIPYWNGSTGRLESSAIFQKTDGSSNVGVSNSNPQRRLHINSYSSPALRLENSSSNQGIEMLTQTYKYSWLLGAQYNIDGGFEITPSTEVGGTTFSTPVAVFKANGNVGIGTTNPASYGNIVALTVGDNSLYKQGLLKFRSSYNSGDGAELWQRNDGLFIHNINGSVTVYTIQPNGNFGIGYNDKSEKFAVAGSGYFDSSVTIRANTGALALGLKGRSDNYCDFAFYNYDGTGNTLFESGNTFFDIYTYTTSWVKRLSIHRSSGGVGIGYDGVTDYKLKVNGSGYFNDDLKVGISKRIGWEYGDGNMYNWITNSYANDGGILYRSGSWTSGDASVIISHNFQTWLSGAWSTAFKIYQNRSAYFTSYLYAGSYIESASYLKGTSVKIGANWEAIPNGNDLELRYGGVMKAKLSSSGDILAVGGVTAFAV